MKLLRSFILSIVLSPLLALPTFAQDDMMDDGYPSEMSEPALMDEMPAPTHYEEEAPLPSEENWDGPTSEPNAYPQEERLDDYDSYDEDY